MGMGCCHPRAPSPAVDQHHEDVGRPASSPDPEPAAGGEDEPPVAPPATSEPPPGHSTMEVKCPPGVKAGAVLRVKAPDGTVVQAPVPAGKGPGQTFQVHYMPDPPTNNVRTNATNALGGLVGNKLANKLINKATEVSVKSTGKSPEQLLESAKNMVHSSTAEWRQKLSSQLETALSSCDESKLNTLLDSALAGSLMKSGAAPSSVRKAANHVASKQLRAAITSGDPKQLKGALVAAKRLSATEVPEFHEAATKYKEVRKLPPGFDMKNILLNKKGVNMVAKMRVNDPAVMMKFQRLLDLTHRKVYTRDRLGQPVPDKLELMSVQTITNADVWGDYMARRETIRQDLQKDHEDFVEYTVDTAAPPEEGKADSASGESAADIVAAMAADFEQPLLKDVNEVFLFHGTSATAADKIAEADFNINLAGSSAGTLYGRGVYLAENCTKSDEYTRPLPNGHRHLVICRATLGRVYYTDAKETDPRACEDSCLKGRFHAVLGDRKKARGTFREFILFDEEQIYPNYILTYKRVGGHVEKGRTMEVVCPAGTTPGTTLQVQAPDGTVVHVIVPTGLSGGQKFTVQY